MPHSLAFGLHRWDLWSHLCPSELYCPHPGRGPAGFAGLALLGWGWRAPDSTFLSCSNLKLNIFSIAYLELESLVSKPGLLCPQGTKV